MAGLGQKKQVLIVGNDGVQLYVLKGKSISLYSDFSESGGNLSEDLKQAFKNIGLPLVILFDVVEQQYRRENIPKVGFLDKNKVIKRKLQMAFPQQHMRAFIILKQKPREGEGLVALFASLNSNLTITQIMDALIGSEVVVDGAGLLPLESTKLVARLTDEAHKASKTKNTSRWSILITHHKTGGLRQVVVKDGELALTRMTPIVVDENDAHALAEEIVREFNATLTYLSRFGYAAGDGLDLVTVSTPDVSDELANYNLPVNYFYPMSVAQACQMLGLKSPQTREINPFGEILHAGWTAMQNSLVVPLSAPLFDKIKQARQISRFAILALFAGAAYLGWQVLSMNGTITNLQNDIVVQQDQKIPLQMQFDELSKSMTPLKYEASKVKVLMDVYDFYNNKNLDMEPTFAAMMPLVDPAKIRLEEVRILENLEGASSMVAPVTDSTMAPVVPLADIPPVPKPWVTMSLKIKFPEGTMVEDAARHTLEFADKLQKRFPGRVVTIDEMAGDLSLNKTVQGGSEQLAEGKIVGREVKDESSQLTFKGALE